jgi:hypothetical protein
MMPETMLPNREIMVFPKIVMEAIEATTRSKTENMGREKSFFSPQKY